MKKIISIFLLLALCVALCACGDEFTKSDDSGAEAQSTDIASDSETDTDTEGSFGEIDNSNDDDNNWTANY